ncbi:MAG: Ppx/GppA family phosphatase [Nitrospirae bacterium]|nr:Ppx/GppA family phosphatase [Nitrospirota bacterium]
MSYGYFWRKHLLFAGIDIGTNTLRLLIAEFSPDGKYRKVKSERHITRLGEGISSTGRLKETAMERTSSVLKRFAKICSEYPLDGIYAVATSAVREASNGPDFIKKIKSEAGLDVDVISGDEEARLTMLGIASGLDLKGSDFLLMDIGGGSTEFIFASEGDIISKVSTDIGVVRFTEQYLKSDPPQDEEIEKLETAISERLNPLKGDTPPPYQVWALGSDFGMKTTPPSPPLVRGGKSMANDNPPLCSRGGMGGYFRMNNNVCLVGTAGTVTTLAAIDQKMTVYDPRKINGYKITREGIGNIRSLLLAMTMKKRMEIPGIEDGMEDLIAAGVVLVDKVMERFGFNEILVSDSGLREGLVLDIYQKTVNSGQ